MHHIISKNHDTPALRLDKLSRRIKKLDAQIRRRLMLIMELEKVVTTGENAENLDATMRKL